MNQAKGSIHHARALPMPATAVLAANRGSPFSCEFNLDGAPSPNGRKRPPRITPGIPSPLFCSMQHRVRRGPVAVGAGLHLLA